MKKQKITFQEYYQNLIPDLEILRIKNLPILRFSEKNRPKIQKIFSKNNWRWQELDWHKNAVLWPKELEFGEEIEAQNLFYLQNASSLLPVLALEAKKNEKILDACAAPGGKALFISESSCKLTVSDASQKRLQRLLQTFKDHQQSLENSHTGNAATIFKKYPEYFDKIIIDAPCSSEKHVYNSPKHLKEWSPGRIRQLKQRQISLINGLFLALKPGGRIVYSTCAINPEENQGVIAKFLKKYQEECQIIPYPSELPGYQKDSPYGFIDIQDPKNQNLDPMFIAIIEKNGIL